MVLLRFSFKTARELTAHETLLRSKLYFGHPAPENILAIPGMRLHPNRLSTLGPVR